MKVVREIKDLGVLFKWRYSEAINPVHPFKIAPPKKITDEHVRLLREWDSVWDSAWASVGGSIWDSVRDSVWASVWISVWDSVWDSVGISVWASVWDSVEVSVWDSVRAYIGYIIAPVV